MCLIFYVSPSTIYTPCSTNIHSVGYSVIVAVIFSEGIILVIFVAVIFSAGANDDAQIIA